MATIITRRPLVSAAIASSLVASTLYLSRQRMSLDSAQNEPSKALSFPKSMLFSQQLRVQSVEQVNHDTKKITFSLPGGMREVSGVPASSAILTQHTPSGAWFPVLRPYTPISSPDERGSLTLLVKQYPGGRASGHLHSLQPGESLTVRGPLPGYSYTPSEKQERSVLLVAGGAGITPIYSLARAILTEHPADKTKVQLLWGVNGTRDIVLKQELEDLERRFPERLSVKYAVSGTQTFGDAEKYRAGYVDQNMVQEAVKAAGASWGDEKGTKVFLCGPPKMEEALAGKGGVLGELGLAKKEIHRF